MFKDEFVTAGGVPLSEVLSLCVCYIYISIYQSLEWKNNSGFLPLIKISLNTMESRKQPRLFFAGEVLLFLLYALGFHFAFLLRKLGTITQTQMVMVAVTSI